MAFVPCLQLSGYEAIRKFRKNHQFCDSEGVNQSLSPRPYVILISRATMKIE